MKQTPEQYRAAYARYRNGRSFRMRQELRRRRFQQADQLMRCFDPIRSCAEVAREVGVSKQRIHTELREIFYKITLRMMNSNFKP